MKPESIGIHIRYPEPFSLDSLIQIISKVDELGFDCIYVADQLASYLEPMEFLSFIAGRTERARQGTCIYLLPLRSPFHVAKQVASIQRVSGRRFTLGVGVGWRKGEYDVLGVNWEARGRMADEALQILNLAWQKDVFSFKGDFFSAEMLDLNCRLEERPEVLIGGNSIKAMRRAANYGDGWIPTDFSVEDYRSSLPILQKELAKAGRDASSLKIASHLLLSLGRDRSSAERIAAQVAKDFGVEVEDMRGWSLVGSPSEIAERLALYSSLGVSYHVLALPPSIGLDALEESLVLLAKEMLPSV
ncbi:MAG: LLM class flavin-dependent oxidoreductase [Conexivisphaerales archaeon]